MVYSETASRSVRLSVWLVLALGVAGAQVYPGQSPYPGQRPYPGGTGIPIPGRSPRGQPKPSANQPLPNFRGTLKRLDDKTVSLQLDDNRVLDFRRTGKTKFFKDGNELKTPQFATGDQISVEGPEEADGTMTAVNVYWEKAAVATETAGSNPPAAHSPEKDKKEGVPDTWANEAPAPGAPPAPADPDRPVLKRAQPADPPAAATPAAPSAAPAPAAAPPPAAKAQASAEVDSPPPPDPDRPVLKRGKPADPAREHAGPVPEQPTPSAAPPFAMPPTAPAEAAPAVAAPGIPRSVDDEDAAPIVRRRIDETDQLIRRATDAALDFTEALPTYVCQEIMSRFQSESHPVRFQALDVLSMNVVYENGKEDYRDLTINGKPTNKTLQESGGAWSTGEFGTVLIDLFAPTTAADFHFLRDSRIAGINAKLYGFDVKREHSHWDVHVQSQSYSPAYRGSVWIDPQTARVLRIEMEAYGFPEAFPLDHVESATDYQYVRLGDARQYLLPVHAENLSCQRGSNVCGKIAIDFRNYHKYSGESTITFGAPKP